MLLERPARTQRSGSGSAKSSRIMSPGRFSILPRVSGGSEGPLPLRRACGRRARARRRTTTSSSSAAGRRGSPSRTTWRRTTGSRTSPCSSRATSARAPRAGTRRSSARTTARPRGRASTRASVELFEGLSRGARLQRALHAARSADARPLRPRDDHDDRARLGRTSCSGSTRRSSASTRSASSARSSTVPRRHLADHRRDVARARRDHPPRRRRLGVRARRRPGRGRDPPVHGGHRDHARERPRHERRDEPRPDLVRHRRQRDRRLVVAGRDLAGVRLPITTHILQAFVTEPLKRFLDVIIVSSQMHVYIPQTTAASS